MSVPLFVQRSPLLSEAYETALAAHHGPRRRGETDIDHPVAVAEVLFEYGFTDEEVLAAALLHDVVEDTATDVSEIGSEFGSRVQRLVAEMTEDRRIESYARRKAEHRRRVTRDGSTAAIYAADKLARSRQIRREHDGASQDRLDHYLKTVDLLCETHPELPFLPDLREELELLAAEASASPTGRPYSPAR